MVGKTTKKTDVHEGGGKNPDWKQFKSGYTFQTQDWWTEKVLLEVFEVDNVGSDDKVGIW